ncbi:histidine phosphatase family protein [Terribacillus saccharophilus]|uniref:Probable phosphoglycerate mutase n=1 Tax=Terribacillus saccharophilus TaxID=361277 RepID=A0AAX2E9P0_9BACI|nr:MULTISPECIES: histidine phosphatase family protein [Terribacillus]MCM3224310.1 histidine phosphatase family protein [Terribacillus saccharophilus]MEC0283786.1 histidine phosphatase family protein [Terribacillus saccharophilus]MEC0290742.1 histidine phosphatase family protein [Terribacillus saccharophilus]SEM50048.1 probable phosphoglycerate mutase [Terribacillus saccharophilus]
MKKTLYLMRHGQTLFNQRKKVQGWCDSPLTELGVKQAETAGKYFKERNIIFDDAYSSTSERASDTLELVTDMPYTRLKGLKEWNFGTFEGESEDLNPPLPYNDFFVKYGGEDQKELQERMAAACQKIMEEDNEVVLAVSHGAACRNFMRYWEHTSTIVQQNKIGNCCILKFEYENKEFKLVEIINHDFSDLIGDLTIVS